MANKKRSERCFEEEDWVYLKLQPYKQSFVSSRSYPKLATKYFGPYQIIKKIGAVAYSVKLPSQSKIHNTFHVSLLKKHHGPIPADIDNSIPEIYDSGSLVTRYPQSVLEIRNLKKNNAAMVQWLVKWQDYPEEEATWENATTIIQKFPSFDPWGQGSSHGRGINTMCVVKAMSWRTPHSGT
ncbi:uncharacterized protein LOC141690939 [Apium graveolens]|uniref:uncharacterized protein LOC141690939 n=1 Tax=Apium graveolens TaxID=4045 RepID=UPI003D7BB886